ncbi:MAG: FHA domain-containing protein [Chloroflexota bacterium]|nr:MAG: FHA domain-containing protein [Chloroflexota bacterium]
MAKYCPHCGVRVSRPEFRFCTVCGNSLDKPASRPGASPALLIQQLGAAPRPVPITKPLVTIGREPTSDIVIPNVIVSRQHAELKEKDGAYWIADTKSTNGTMVNGQQLEPFQERQLKSGDIIRIGDDRGNSISLAYQDGAEAAPITGTVNLGTTTLTHLTVSSLGRDPENDIHLDHPFVSKRHAEIKPAASGGFVLRDLNSTNGTFVNERPLRGEQLLRDGDWVQIGPFKLAYQNGELTRFTPGGNYRLDALSLGREVTIKTDLSLSRLFGRGDSASQLRILDDISLSIYPKEFVGLVGGSGAGKSTLLKALSGFSPANQGQVIVNGDDLYTNFSAYRSIMGYVPQDDIIHGQLTVRGALTYASRLRLPDATPAEIEQRIQKVLAQVEMSEHVDKQINRLSGGQRKRVSIAVELLAEPGLFFLDEPTSGLDPGLEKKMMKTLRELADDGRTIVLVTHATANIDQCNLVAFMAYARLTYYGPPEDTESFFGTGNFADVYSLHLNPADASASRHQALWSSVPQSGLETVVGPQAQTAEQWADQFRNSPQYKKYVADRLGATGAKLQPEQSYQPSRKQRVSPLHQFSVLARRYLDLISRDRLSLIILLAVMPVIGLLLLIMTDPYDLVGKGPEAITAEIQESIDEKRLEEDPALIDEQFQGTYVVAGSAQRLLFMLALAASLLGIFAAAYEIVKEQAIYRRERMINLMIVPYLSSKIIILALFALLQCFLLLLVLGVRVHYPSEGVFMPATAEMYVTLLLATIASISLGLLISAVVKSENTVIYLILVVLFIQIIFAGAIFDLPAAAKPISYVTTTRWTLEALGSSADMQALNEKGVTCVEFEDEQMLLMAGEPEAPCIEGQMKQPALSTFNVDYERDVGHLLLRWLALLLFAVIFSSLAGILQRRKDVI